MERKNKTQEGKKKKAKKTHTEGGKKEQVRNLSFIRRR